MSEESDVHQITVPPPTTGWDALVTLAMSEPIQQAIAKRIEPFDPRELLTSILPLAMTYFAPPRQHDHEIPPPPQPIVTPASLAMADLLSTFSEEQRKAFLALLTDEQLAIARAYLQP